MSVFKEWPVDATKRGRCLGEHLRKNFNQTFSKGELTDGIDEAQWQKILDHIKPIAANSYASKYARRRGTAALNLSRDQCKLVNSDEAKKILNEDTSKRIEF